MKLSLAAVFAKKRLKNTDFIRVYVCNICILLIHIFLITEQQT